MPTKGIPSVFAGEPNSGWAASPKTPRPTFSRPAPPASPCYDDRPIPGALVSIREIKRRAFIAALGGAAVWPMATCAPSACSKPTRI
jgi:hypothetical protein